MKYHSPRPAKGADKEGEGDRGAQGQVHHDDTPRERGGVGYLFDTILIGCGLAAVLRVDGEVDGDADLTRDSGDPGTPRVRGSGFRV